MVFLAPPLTPSPHESQSRRQRNEHSARDPVQPRREAGWRASRRPRLPAAKAKRPNTATV